MGVEALGVELNGSQLRTTLTLKRFTRLHRALGHALSLRRVSGDCVRVLVGHCTFCALVRRPGLSVFHDVDKFMNSVGPEGAELWASARRELEVFRGLLVLLVSDWWTPWNRDVLASDASLTGYGVASSRWTVAEVSRIGRVRERDRFLDPSVVSARRSAIRASGLTR